MAVGSKWSGGISEMYVHVHACVAGLGHDAEDDGDDDDVMMPVTRFSRCRMNICVGAHLWSIGSICVRYSAMPP